MTIDQIITLPLVLTFVRIILILALGVLVVLLMRRWLPGVIYAYLSRVQAFGPAFGRPMQSPDDLRKRVATLSGVIGWITEVLLLMWVILAVLHTVDIDTGPALASFGVVGIALGLGAQTLVKDWINGAFILLEDQYRKGDVVKVAGVSGLVEDISLRRTILRDIDGTVHSIPNSEIRTSSNLTRDWSRVNLDIAVTYDADVAAAAQVLNQVGEELAQDPQFGPMITEPPSFQRVDAFHENGMTLKVLGVTKPMKQWDVMGEYRRRVLPALAAAGIDIPYPHRVMVTRPTAAAPADGVTPPPDPAPSASDEPQSKE